MLIGRLTSVEIRRETAGVQEIRSHKKDTTTCLRKCQLLVAYVTTEWTCTCSKTHGPSFKSWLPERKNRDAGNWAHTWVARVLFTDRYFIRDFHMWLHSTLTHQSAVNKCHRMKLPDKCDVSFSLSLFLFSAILFHQGFIALGRELLWWASREVALHKSAITMPLPSEPLP